MQPHSRRSFPSRSRSITRSDRLRERGPKLGFGFERDDGSERDSGLEEDRGSEWDSGTERDSGLKPDSDLEEDRGSYLTACHYAQD